MKPSVNLRRRFIQMNYFSGLKSECFVGGEPSRRFDIDHVVDEIESVNFVQSDIDESE